MKWCHLRLTINKLVFIWFDTYGMYIILIRQDPGLKNGIAVSASESIPEDLVKRHRRNASGTPSIAVSRASLASGKCSLVVLILSVR